MRRSVKLFALNVLALLMISVCVMAEADVFPGGWRNPLGTDGGDLSIISGGRFNDDKYYAQYASAHGGVDMYYHTGAAREEEPVYSIGDGVIDYVKRVSNSTKNDSVIHVRYTADDGTEFKATYGHTYALSGLAEGTKVTRGQQIGTTRHWNSYHLHFAVVWNRQKTPGVWGGLDSDLLGSSTSTQARLEKLHQYGWWEPFEFLAAHPYEKPYEREPFYGAVVVMGQAEFHTQPDAATGTGDYAERSDVLSVYALITDGAGEQWYALSRTGGYYVSADDVDVIISFGGEPVRLTPIDTTVSTDSLNARVGDVIYVYSAPDDRYTGGSYALESSYMSCADPDIARVDSPKGGRVAILGMGQTTIRFNCQISTPEGRHVSWYYEVPLTVAGTVDVGNTQRYEVVYSSGLRIRELPTTSSSTVVVMPNGRLFTADMDRTVEADGYTWAYVTAESGESGWTAISNSSYCVPVTGFTLVQAGTSGDSHRYLVYKGACTWAEANSFAATLGEEWHLATITSAEEQAVVSRLVSAYGGTCWLGARYSSGWKWVTGEAFSYTNWDSGEPSGNSSEPYLGIYGNSTQTSYATDGKWNDFKATTSTVNGFVVEKDAVRTISFTYPAVLCQIGLQGNATASVEPPLAEGETLTYIVDDPSVLVVHDDGSFEGLKEGMANITVTAPCGASATLKVYMMDQHPVTISSHELVIDLDISHTIRPMWDETATMRAYMTSFEVEDAYADTNLVQHDGGTSFTGLKPGITNLFFDLRYTTNMGEVLFDTVLVPAVVGRPFTPEREHYECTVGDSVRIFYELAEGHNEDALCLYWESSDEDVVTVDQTGLFTVLDYGYPAIQVYATWYRIPVGYIDLSFWAYKTADLPRDLTVLEENALRGISVQRIDARGTALTRIESGAMAGIDGLRSVCLDESVTYIAPDAFGEFGPSWIHCPEGSYAHQWALEHGYSPNVW